MSAALTIPVNGIYFDQIAAGTKLEEYRLCTPFWEKRLAGRSYGAVVMTRGYPKAGGVEGITRLTRRWRGYQRKTITHPHFGIDPVEVFAIDVAEARGTWCSTCGKDTDGSSECQPCAGWWANNRPETPHP